MSLAEPIFPPSAIVNPVNVPTEVMFVCAAVVSVTSAIYVFILDAAILRFVPPAPLSTIKRSASASASPMSAPPSMSIVVMSPS